MIIYQVLYIVSTFILIYGATDIYNGNRQSAKHRAFALLFLVMALWQQAALVITLLPAEQAEYVFIYGMIPIIMIAFMLLLHAICLFTGVYTRKYSLLFKLLFIPPLVNIALFPLDGWLYAGDIVMFEHHALPGPGGYINFGCMFVYMMIMIVLLLPKAKRKHRPSQILLFGILAHVTWVLLLVVAGELLATVHFFYAVPLGINFWAVAVYIAIYKYGSLPSYEKKYRILFEHAPIGILNVDKDGIIHEVSPRAAKTMDRPVQQIIGRSLFEWCDEKDRQDLFEQYKEHYRIRKPFHQYEMSFANSRGELRHISISSDFIEMSGEVYQLLMIVDITEAKQRDEQIRKLAYYDYLTGLHNRVSFQNAFERWKREKAEFALIILDLNDFKNINDRYGHLAGDETLRHFADWLRRCVDPSDFIARLSGDEFVILTPKADEHERLVKSIREGLRRSIELDGVLLELSVSIGVSIYPHDGHNMDAVFKAADDRLYEDKRAYHDRRRS